MKTKKILLVAIVLIGTMYSVLSMGALSYFDDKEKSMGALTTGTWPYVDANSAILESLGDNKYNLLYDVFIIPDDDLFVIKKITIGWAGDNGNKIRNVNLGGKEIWKGISGPGLEIDTNYILDKKVSFDMEFNSDMGGKEFIIQLVFENGLTIEKKFVPEQVDRKDEKNEKGG